MTADFEGLPTHCMCFIAPTLLDSHTEKEIQHSLAKVSKGKTTLVIAHRLPTTVDADQIVVLKDGSIAERGTHVELPCSTE